MKTILVFVAYYLPGFKAGGPLRTIANMVEHLGDEFRFKIVTGDRDFEDQHSYKDVRVGEWNQVGGAEVLYMPPESQNIAGIRRLLNNTEYDVFYLNSFFASRFTILPLLLRKAGLIPNKATVLAPRGEFSSGALALKAVKKRAFIRVVHFLKLYENILWHASSEMERRDLQNILGHSLDVHIALDLPPKPESPKLYEDYPKNPGTLRVVFLSRISPKKNLDGALKMLKGIPGNIVLDVYGPIDDSAYWSRCEQIINSIKSDSLKIAYRGTVPHEQVSETFGQYDLFFFPTHGENYGHVIHEALVAGCPVLLSDQTPWQNLEENYAGWVCKAGDSDAFRDVLVKCIEMDTEEHKKWSAGARDLGAKVSLDENVVEQNRQLFKRALVR